MYDKFSVEEINLMCIFDTSSRSTLLNDLQESLGDIYDPDMCEVFGSAISKLENTSDDEFEDIGFYIANDFPDSEET